MLVLFGLQYTYACTRYHIYTVMDLTQQRESICSVLIESVTSLLGCIGLSVGVKLPLNYLGIHTAFNRRALPRVKEFLCLLHTDRKF